MVNAVYDRQSSIGFRQNIIPKDADAVTIDWEKSIEVTNKIPIDAKKFFLVAAFKEVGTGVAEDLFIHLLSGRILSQTLTSRKIFTVPDNSATERWKKPA